MPKALKPVPDLPIDRGDYNPSQLEYLLVKSCVALGPDPVDGCLRR